MTMYGNRVSYAADEVALEARLKRAFKNVSPLQYEKKTISFVSGEQIESIIANLN